MTAPAYRIVTPQLLLRCYTPADAPLFAEAIAESIEHLLPWMPWAASEPQPLEAKIERLRRFRANFDLDKDFVYGIFNPQEKRLLGSTGLHPRIGDKALEIGYWIHKDYIGRGYATETAAALTKVAFLVHKVERVEIHCAVENARSAAVPRKLGFHHEATLKNRSYAYGRPCDQMVWTLFAEEYPSSPAAQLEIAAYDAAERRIL
ncbi:MAG: GNAT family N-acetyltransferase [Anaerolineales bacterium]|nr:GNAT family N-acetyltransferase [Anaerolineales bacterium]MDW8278221.1 GNAT family protein [Anaerolineales bacterium]